jgi:hypothetical protein
MLQRCRELVLLHITLTCGGAFNIWGAVEGCSSLSSGSESNACGCPEGSILGYGSGCDAKPTCFDLSSSTCTFPDEVKCTCATHQLVHVGRCYGGLAPVPVESDPTACAPDAGLSDAEVPTCPGGCGYHEICGQMDGTAAFTCCDPSKLCGRCTE